MGNSFTVSSVAVLIVIAAAVHRGGHDLVQAEHGIGARGGEQALGALAGVDVAGEHGLGVAQDGPGVVGEHDLAFGARALDHAAVIVHIVHAGEGVLFIAEQLAVAGLAEHVAPGVDARSVQLVLGDEVVAHLVAGVAEHKHDLFAAPGNAAQAYGETVAAEDGPNHAHRAAAQLLPNVAGNILNGGVVALAAGHHRLGNPDHVAVAQGKAFAFGCGQNRVYHDAGHIVALPDDRGTDAPRNGTHQTLHTLFAPLLFNASLAAVCKITTVPL